MTETQTGFQHRRPKQSIDEAALRASLAAVHYVPDAERAVALLRDDLERFLDPGEQAALGTRARPQR